MMFTRSTLVKLFRGFHSLLNCLSELLQDPPLPGVASVLGDRDLVRLSEYELKSEPLLQLTLESTKASSMPQF